MKYFVFGDVHSYFDIWMKALKDAGFKEDNDKHILISLGDLLDRGDKSLECLTFINSLPDYRKILIRGNHEDLLNIAIARRCFYPHDIHNQTDKTVYTLVGNEDDEVSALQIMSTFEPWNTYVRSCVDYYELGNNVFVHGWIPYVETLSSTPEYKVSYSVRNWKKGNWDTARWSNGMECWKNGIFLKGKTIWCGHWHTSWGHAYLHGDGREFLSKVETMYIDPITGKLEPHVNFDPFIDKGIIAMDSCVPYSKKINVKVIEYEDNY